uniref:Uncharacterized protein n=1 Tax=viral metagenome TaxID=1070528 RepID=A0A6C0BE99_9ZZZZ
MAQKPIKFNKDVVRKYCVELYGKINNSLYHYAKEMKDGMTINYLLKDKKHTYDKHLMMYDMLDQVIDKLDEKTSGDNSGDKSGNKSGNSGNGDGNAGDAGKSGNADDSSKPILTLDVLIIKYILTEELLIKLRNISNDYLRPLYNLMNKIYKYYSDNVKSDYKPVDNFTDVKNYGNENSIIIINEELKKISDIMTTYKTLNEDDNSNFYKYMYDIYLIFLDKEIKDYMIKIHESINGDGNITKYKLIIYFNDISAKLETFDKNLSSFFNVSNINQFITDNFNNINDLFKQIKIIQDEINKS